ncbi:MAG: hypothetical protein H0X50_10220 [Nitrosopumilus sp.]|nr:hypothetical protein [Nitrosopumilus sp.]
MSANPFRDGLGLLISKKICGRMLAENNNNVKGDKFSFSLHLENSG